MKPQEIAEAIEAKTLEFKTALETERSNHEVIHLYWEIKELRLQLLQLN